MKNGRMTSSTPVESTAASDYGQACNSTNS